MLTDSPQLPLAAALWGMTPPQVALLASGVVLVITISRWRKRTVDKKRLNTPPMPAPAQNPMNMRVMNAEITALLAEVEETARRLTAQIDNRYTRLEQLVAEADEKIRRLEELTASQKSGVVPQNLGTRQPAPAPIEPAPEKAMLHRSASETAKPVIKAQPAAASIDAQRVLSRLRQDRGAPPATQDPAYQPIYSLADLGKTAREIAQQLGRQPGEVELILALRGR